MKVNFIYNNHKYPFDIELFSTHSDYFSGIKEEITEKKNINLLSDFENHSNLSEESIVFFIDYCQNKEIQLTNLNVLSVNYLSHKYKVSSLIQKTEEFINNNLENIITQILSSKQFYHQDEIFISNHMKQVASNKLSLQIPISSLCRILSLYSARNKYVEEDIIDFLFNYVEHQGIKASIIFTFVEFGEKGRDVLIKNIIKHPNYLDSQMLSSKICESIVYIKEEQKKKESFLINEIKNIKEIYDNQMKEMKNDYDNQIMQLKTQIKEIQNLFTNKVNEINNDTIEKVELQQQLQNEIIQKVEQQQKTQNEITDKIEQQQKLQNEITKKVEQQQQSQNEITEKVQQQNELLQNVEEQRKIILDVKGAIEKVETDQKCIEKSFNETKNLHQKVTDDIYNIQIEQLKKIIFDIDSSQYLLKNNSFDGFNRLGGESQLFILWGIKDRNNCKIIQDLLKLLLYFSKEQKISNHEYNESNYISIYTKDMYSNILNTKSIDKIIISSSVIEMLYENYSLESTEFVNLINNFENIYFEVQYPTENYEPIYDLLLNIKEKNNLNFKILVSIQLDEQENKIFQYNKFINAVKLDSSINNPKVSFEGCTSIEEVIIKPSIKNLSDDTFKGCSNIIQIEFNPYETHIQENTFRDCNLYKHFAISTSSSIIFHYNFETIVNQLRINQISIPPSVTSIADNTFNECNSLENVTIPNTVKSIGNYSFNKCISLHQIKIPSSIESIGECAFWCCISLTKIDLPSSINSIGRAAFGGCSSLIEINLPLAIGSFGQAVLSCCAKMNICRIPPLLSIPGSMFLGCISLTEVIIPSTVQSIQSRAFNGCNSLIKITIPPNVKKIESHSFEKCTSLVSITLTSSVEHIDSYAFRDCSSLKEVTIYSTNFTLGNNVFQNCPLRQITAPPSTFKIFNGQINRRVKLLKI